MTTERPDRDAAGTSARIGDHLRSADAYGFLLILIVATIVASAVSGDGKLGRVVVLVLFTAVPLLALKTSRPGRMLLRLAYPLVLVVGAAGIAVVLGGDARVGRAGLGGATTILFVIAILAIARRLLRHAEIDGRTVAGALCVYLLLGMTFAAVYGLVGAIDPGPFFVNGEDGRAVDLLYFSYVTLATVGYGDFTAATDVGRMLAITEALIGQLYLVTVVALLVSNIGRRRTIADLEDESS